MKNIKNYDDFANEGFVTKSISTLILGILLNINNAVAGGGGAAAAAVNREIRNAIGKGMGSTRFPDDPMSYKNIRDKKIDKFSLRKALRSVDELIIEIKDRWGFGNTATNTLESLRLRLERAANNERIDQKELRLIVIDFQTMLDKTKIDDPLFDKVIKHISEHDNAQLTRDYYMLYDYIYKFDKTLYLKAKDIGNKVSHDIMMSYLYLLGAVLLLALVAVILISIFDN